MSSTTKLLTVYIQGVVTEAKLQSKRLRIFDFDDTLVKTDAKVHVTDAAGVTFELAPAEFAVYEKVEGDTFDYTDFERLINPRTIKWMCRILHNVYAHHGPQGLVVLSARGHSAPIKKFLDEMGLINIEIVALGDANPQTKALWIDARIKRDELKNVEFFDDSHKNVAAVRGLREHHHDVEIVARHIIHNRIDSLNSQ